MPESKLFYLRLHVITIDLIIITIKASIAFHIQFNTCLYDQKYVRLA
jgi:hypothetical protein